MKMIRKVYHIDGKDYNEYEQVTIQFNVLAISIQNFLNLAKENHLAVYWFGKMFTDLQQTTTNGDMKSFKLTGNSQNMVKMALQLGKNEVDKLNDNWNIRNSNLRAKQFTRCLNTRFTGFSCFDPATKKTSFKSNTPIKIPGKQAIINGKLWRKYYSSSDMRN